MSKKANLKTYSFWHPSVSSYDKIESRAHKVCDFFERFQLLQISAGARPTPGSTAGHLRAKI